MRSLPPSRLLAGIRAVVFDFDGVLADSTTAHAAAWHTALDSLGAAGRAAPFEVTGRSSVQYAQNLVDDLDLAVPASELVRRKLVAYGHHRTSVALMAGARELLDQLDARAIRVAIATNENSESLDSILQHTGVLHRFDVRVTRDDVTSTKPAPDPYARAAELLGVQPTSCLAVEDTPVGLRSAIAARMHTCALLTSLPAKALADATFVAKDLVELAQGFAEARPAHRANVTLGAAVRPR